MTPKPVYPYIPNSAPGVKRKMLEETGAESVEDFYASIPDALRFHGQLNLPEPYLDEGSLRRHVEGLLQKNTSCNEILSFLGGGCWQHYVPSICDEVNQRSEFLTAYAGEPYEDHGRFQALFEYESMLGELLDMDVVNVPTYDGLQASATAARMAGRLNGRKQVLVPQTLFPQRLSKMIDYCRPDLALHPVAMDPETGGMDLEALESQLSDQTAAVFFENPSYLGFLEPHAAAIAVLAHAAGAECIVAADPISLGVLAPPVQYGADIVCGDIQPLGMHMQYGGGLAGYIATRDEPRYVMEFPSRLFGLSPTMVPGEYGLGDVAYERTSFALREEGKEFIDTASALWGITAGVYLALMGPQGMQEMGEGLMLRARYAMQQLAALPGVKLPFEKAHHFKEFVVSFRETGKSVEQINRALLGQGIFGGHDLGQEFPELEGCALYAVTEQTTKVDIDRLVTTLQEVL